MSPRKYPVYKSILLITDEEKFAFLLSKIDNLGLGQAYRAGEYWSEIFSTFPTQSRGVRIGNTVATIENEEWTVKTVTEENYTELRTLCHIGTITHEISKIDSLLAEEA